MTPGWQSNPDVVALLESDGPAVFVVPVDPEQTYFPKVTSRIQEDGSMMSNPVSRMTPELEPDIDLQVFRFFAGRDLPHA
jgi:acetolactate synthase-1/2/3 large subunit